MIEKNVSHLPETVRAAQITQVSVGGHPGVELTAQNDGGCRKDCRGEKKMAFTKNSLEEQEDVLSASFRLRKKESSAPLRFLSLSFSLDAIVVL